MTALPRPEYPRPQFERNDWLNLNGEWRFDFDDANLGLKGSWYKSHSYSRRITVPFAFQTKLSGIGEIDLHDIVWYERDFELPAKWSAKKILLHFGAVDYGAWVWVNGIFVCQHEGGHVPFCADISHALHEGVNQISLRVEDSSTDLEQPRGKQYWERESKSIWYTRTTGIWQTVWLEAVEKTHLESFKITPEIDSSEIQLQAIVANFQDGLELEAQISYQGALVTTSRYKLEQARSLNRIMIEGDLHLWSPENPALYDLQLRLWHGNTLLDDVKSYFGMRKIAVQDGKVMLNNQAYYMRLVLDQGYHPDGLLTYPSDEAIKLDAELTKQLGFNGVRKHQKVEEPRYLYWADHLGLLVWGEMANSYEYSEKALERITKEWQEAIERDYNHPSIVAWVPINESWGVPNLKADSRQIDHLLALYYLVRSIDPSRLVISNDGWEHAKTDLLTIHDYEGSGHVLRERYGTLDAILASKPANRDFYVKGFAHSGEPILLTEFGGIAFQKDTQKGWGYTTAGDDEEFIRRYRDVVDAVLASPLVQGFCYTQLTDVEQEINGLLTYRREAKVDLAIIQKINLG
jgi:beta-galactosidase/beta-glucuronidase